MNGGLALAKEIQSAYEKNQSRQVVIYGETGVGKSVYAIKVLKQLYDDPQHPEEWKQYIVFTPEQFITLVTKLLREKRRAKCIVWDDAGYWLFALDWNDPKVKAAMKMFQVSRTVTAAIIFTTPAVQMIIKKIQAFEGIRIGKVMKRTSGDSNLRLCKVYRNTIAAFGKRYVKQKYEDDFSVMLPDGDYNWYAPIRERYLEDATELMKKAYGIKEDTISS